MSNLLDIVESLFEDPRKTSNNGSASSSNNATYSSTPTLVLLDQTLQEIYEGTSYVERTRKRLKSRLPPIKGQDQRIEQDRGGESFKARRPDVSLNTKIYDSHKMPAVKPQQQRVKGSIDGQVRRRPPPPNPGAQCVTLEIEIKQMIKRA